MIPSGYSKVHNAADSNLSDLKGLAHALWRITFESCAIDHSKPDATSISALISAIEAKIDRAIEHQEQAWAAISLEATHEAA